MHRTHNTVLHLTLDLRQALHARTLVRDEWRRVGWDACSYTTHQGMCVHNETQHLFMKNMPIWAPPSGAADRDYVDADPLRVKLSPVGGYSFTPTAIESICLPTESSLTLAHICSTPPSLAILLQELWTDQCNPDKSGLLEVATNLMCATYLLTGIQAVGATPELTTYTLRHADGSELSAGAHR